MTGDHRHRRRDPGRDATRVALVEAAEALFAQSGIDGVTTRQIQEAAGSGNKNVIAYYFGGKAALIDAIYRHREPPMEARRAELLASLDAAGAGQDLAGLLDALYRPLLEQTDAQGRHSYSRFLAALQSGWAWTRLDVRADYQVTESIVDRMRGLVPPTVARHFQHRFSIVYTLIAAALRMSDEHQDDDGLTASQRYFDAVRVGAAALCVPFEGDAG
jgi:AcrR family transcriptional regulator